jgi:F0F1-type ATP synthase membrane subunit b/b'
LLSIIDQMRVSIPEDIKKGQQILAQRDRIIAQGQEEANRTLQIAREKANQLLEKDAIIQSAQNRAGQIIEQAKLDSEVNKVEADEYIIKSLTDLEAQLVVLLNQVKNGIQALSNTTQVIQPETEEEGQ